MLFISEKRGMAKEENCDSNLTVSLHSFICQLGRPYKNKETTHDVFIRYYLFMSLVVSRCTRRFAEFRPECSRKFVEPHKKRLIPYYSLLRYLFNEARRSFDSLVVG